MHVCESLREKGGGGGEVGALDVQSSHTLVQ